MSRIAEYAGISAQVLSEAERFWDRADVSTDLQKLQRFSFFMGLFPFAGYLFSYTITGRVWNLWPFINSTLPVYRAVMCAGLQWVFYATFPTISTLLLDLFVSRRPSPPDSGRLTAVAAYSMVPLHLSGLFAGALFINISAWVIGFSIFVYLVYFGYRRYLGLGTVQSAFMTSLVCLLFFFIRQMFVFVIGF